MFVRKPPHHRIPLRGLAVLALLGGATYIGGCTCNDDHPYTPFEVATTLESGGGPEGVAPAAPPEEKARRAVVAVAARGQTEWRIFERSFRAPQGLGFDRGFLFDPEGKPLFWLEPLEGDKSAPRGGLYRGDAEGALTLSFQVPSFLPEGADCVTAADAAPSGTATVIIHLRTKCQTARLAGTATAALIFLDADREAPPFGVRLLPSAPGEELRPIGDAQDQDGDGVDDREIRFELSSPRGSQAVASFRWLSRPAGPSRRPEHPARDFTERAERLAISAVRKKERDRVAPEVDALRRLYGAICSESTTGRIALLDGEPLRCGALDRPLASLTHSSITAWLGAGELAAALGEFERADWFGPGPDERQKTALKKLFAEKLPASPAEVLATMELSKETKGWLGWDGAGRLWLHDETDAPIWSANPAREEETDPETERAAAPVPRAPDPQIGPNGRRLVHVLPSCDRSEVQVLLQSPGEAGTPQPLPILAPRPAACDKFGRGPLRGRVVQFRGTEADLLIEGQPISERGAQVVPRAPLAWHTQLGLALLDQGGLRLWTTGRHVLEHNCALRGDQSLAACVHGRTVVVYAKAKPEAP